MSNPPQDEYQDPSPEEEYMDHAMDPNQAGMPGGNPDMSDENDADMPQPEVKKGLSSVASTPGKNIAVFAIIILIMIGVIYMLFFSEDTPVDPQDPNAPPNSNIQLPGPTAPDPETLTDIEEPPAPDLDIVQVTPDIVLPELPPLVPPPPPEPPKPSLPANIPGQTQPNETLNFIIGNEELQDASGNPVPPGGGDQSGGAAFNAKAVNSLVMGGEGGGGGADLSAFGGGTQEGEVAGLPPGQLPNTPTFNPNVLADTDAETVVATRIRDMEMTIAQGKLMEAVLETAINTDLPGLVRAIITRNVYAEQGGYILIPRGSRLVGNYESTIKRGQQRVYVIWNRVIRPDGVDVAIQSPGTDRLGRAGVAGIVDDKYFEIFGNSILISTITTSAALFADQFSDTDGVSETENTDGSSRTTGSVSDIAISEAVENLGNVGSDLAEQLLDSQPTITVDQGTRINIFVNRDLVFPPQAATRYIE